MIFFVLLYHQTDFLLLMRMNFFYRIVEEEKVILYSNIFHNLNIEIISKYKNDNREKRCPKKYQVSSPTL